MFHAIPHDAIDVVSRTLDITSQKQVAFDVHVDEPFSLGRRGVAVPITGPKCSPAHGGYHRARAQPLDRLQIIHATLLSHFQKAGLGLTNQDCRRLARPHVTVQNKVGEDDARRCMDEIRTLFDSANSGGSTDVIRDGKAIGVMMWEYEPSGRWKYVRDWLFTGTSE